MEFPGLFVFGLGISTGSNTILLGPLENILNPPSPTPLKYPNHTSAWVFSCKFAAYFQNTFLQEHLWMAASKLWKYSVAAIFALSRLYTVKLIWHIFWIKHCSIKFDVYTITLVWSKLTKLVSKKWTHLTRRCHPKRSSTFCCLKIWVP